MSYSEFFSIFVPIFGGYFYYFSTLLQEKNNTYALVNKLEGYRYFYFYRLQLSKILQRLTKLLGELAWHGGFISKNIVLHYGLSILYVLFSYYFLWLITGQEILSTLNMFEDNRNALERSLNVTILIITFIIIYFLEKKGEATLPNKLSLLIGGSVGIGILSINGYAEGINGVLVVGPLVIVISIIFSYKKSFLEGIYIISLFGLLNIFSFFVLGVTNYILNNSFFTSITIVLYIFLLILPMFNGILDFISLSISRYLSAKIAEDEKIFFIFFHLLLDLILAGVFFMAMLYIVYVSIDVTNSFVGSNIHIPIQEILISTIADPFKVDNLWITFMLLSTLLPTGIHLFLGILAFILYISKLSTWYIFQIGKIKNSSKSINIKVASFLAFPSAFLTLILGYIFLYIPFLYLIKWIQI